MKKIPRSSIRTKILTVFSALLFFAFFLVYMVFNIAVTQYIKSRASQELASYAIIANIPVITEIQSALTPGGGQAAGGDTAAQERRAFNLPHNVIVINQDYGSTMVPGTETAEILAKLKSEGLPPGELLNRRVATQSKVFFVSALPLDRADGTVDYALFYVDMTSLSDFAGRINIILLMLVGIIWITTIAATTFLAGSIARPIRKLSLFATRIGKGDFSTNNLKFYDEELDNLNKRLNQSARQLGVYDSDQKTFFQNVSHELRTPLMSIKCYAEGIKYGVMDAGEAIQTILSETDRLTGMVDDILYISRIDNVTQAFQTEEADLREILEDCVAQQRALASNKNIEIELDMDENPVKMVCGRKLIARAAANLISNAIRYAKSLIRISCREAGGEAVICVRDDGSGIDPEIMPNIFNRFFRGANGNHGIGLSIVKSVAEQHRGSVTAENTESGACFTVRLPLAQ